MNNKDCPCYNCQAPKRHVGCHSDCEEYKNWKFEYAELREKDRESSEYMGYIKDVCTRKMHKERSKIWRGGR